ncbi:MAG: BcpO-related WXXGXW repeat protein [Actinobacteria bacterium]|nr:BcpO-related WXXGXW repeat protein [Actinomycetota bacterium]
MRTLKLFMSAAMLFFVFGFFNASFAAKVVYIRKVPPVKKVVIVKSKSPYKGGIWASGRWVWKNNHYVWTKGRWVKPRKGFVWVNGHWQKNPRGWIWKPGHWKRLR